MKRGVVRVVCPVPPKWDGRCPDCGRGADGFVNGVWCDCLPKPVGRVVRAIKEIVAEKGDR